MLAVLALALSGPHAPPPVAVTDCHRFGVRHEVANMHWRQTRVQRERLDEVIRLNNDADVYEAWRAESRWRLDCWDVLDNSLNEAMPDEFRLSNLRRLYDLLGPAAFFGGVMPTPSCRVRVRADD